jgi:hypothetical protein
MNKVMPVFFLLLFVITMSYPTDNPILNGLFQQSFNDSINSYITEYSLVTGFYTTGGEVKGSAAIGNFPSFRVGATIGTIFMNNPIEFIKKMHFSTTDWNSIRNDSSLSGMVKYLNWFDANFLPLPVNVYNFDIGLFKGFSVGGKFHVVPAGALARTNEAAKKNIYELLSWGIGTNVTYAILKEYNYFPSLSVSTGVNYSDVTVWFDNIAVGDVYLDSNNKVPTTLGFYTHNYTTSFYFDFSVSKTIKFFEPFVSVKFVQTVNYNVTKINVSMDMQKADASAKSLYGDGKFTASNLVKDANGKDVGTVVPVTDFVLTAGFEFIVKIFRFGFESSYGLVSQKGMISLSLRFQVEKADFENFKKVK